MRIAVDARPLCHPGTGIYRYTRELLLRMCAMGAQWYFYSPQPYRSDDFALDNVTHRVVNVPSRLGGSQASQFLFPRWMAQDSVDLFWGSRHHLPFLMPATIPALLTVHDLVWRQQGSSMRWSRRCTERLLMPRSIDRAECIVTGTEYIANELREAYPDVASKLSIIPYGSYVQPITAEKQDDGNESGFFLFVGTMEPRKNLAGLLRAYKSYVAQKPDARKLKLVGGSGWGGVDPRQIVVDLGLIDRVEIIGIVTDEELSNLYLGAFALVMPSLYEGFGLPVVEAMASGVPVIVSHDSALSEIAGNAGFQVDPLSDFSLCEALLALDSNAFIYQRLRAETLPQAARFSWDRCAAEMYMLLRNQT